MTTYAIIHTATRCIRRVTTIDPPEVGTGESVIAVTDGFDIAGGPWKLDVDDATKVAPSEAEKDDAFTTPEPTDITELKAAIQDIIDDGALPVKIKTFVVKLAKALIKQRKRDLLG